MAPTHETSYNKAQLWHWLERGLGFYFVYLYVCMCVCACGGQKPAPGVVSGANHLVFWDSVYDCNLGIVNCTSQLGSPKDCPIFTSLLILSNFFLNKTKQKQNP